MSDVLAALVGIDGTGKTTVARLLSRDGRAAVVHAIRAHDDPESPDAERSRHLAVASAAADEVGHAQLKVAVLYLQMCQYRDAERRALSSGAAGVLADRHPLVDPLVYLPMFAGIKAAPAEPAAQLARWWADLPAGTARTVRDWLARCAPHAADPWTLGEELLGLASVAPDVLLKELSDRFGVALPDLVIRLDLPVAEALRRVGGRDPGRELHGSAGLLTAVDAAYDAALARLGTKTEVRRVACAGRTASSVASEVADLMAGFLPPPAGAGRVV